LNLGIESVTKGHEHHRVVEGHQEMNTLQTELKTTQNNKQANQFQLEPLQEKEVKIIAELEEDKTRMA
jgi:hypothetical protein